MISIIMPSYNEDKNLLEILPMINQVLTNANIEYEILVIDTMTPIDDTATICNSYGAAYISRRNGNNYGDAIRTGIEEANGEFSVIMDADGSHDPKEIIQFYNVMITTGADLVIGSRYCKGGHTENNIILRLMSWALNVTYRLFFKLSVKDVSDSYRLYKTEMLKSLHFECDNFDIVEEILIKLSLMKENFTAVEVPISFNKRNKGKSKRKLLAFVFSYIKTIKRLMTIRKRFLKEGCV